MVLLVVFAANQFATEWVTFRAGAYPTGSAVDFPHYYVAAKLAGSADPSQHPLYYLVPENKEAALHRIPPDTEWNNVAHQNGLGDTLHFSAPPIVATLLTPLGKLPYQSAFMLWRVLTDCVFFLAIWVCLKLCRVFSPVTLLICTLAGFAFQPFLLTLEKGQFGALLLLTWSAGVLFADKKQDLLSALMLALATIVKLTPVLTVGVFVIRRRWKWLAAYMLWMAILIGIGIWHLGVENHRLYLAKLSALSCGVPGPYNYSLSGIVQNTYYRDILDYPHIPAQIPAGLCAFIKVLGLAVYLAVLAFLPTKNQGGDIIWDLVVMSLITLVIAPFTWRHYYVLEILPLMFVWFLLKAGRFSRPGWVLIVAIICTLVAGTRYPDYLQTHLTNGPMRVFLVGLLPLSALLLTATLLFAYKPEPEPQE
ncbi:MAG TPA: glycosyltransferase family 87 protein [Terriglobales bacterium]|nr:glycosyltransferase family 87 protein [Terriglobales bacterium]